MVGVVNDLRVEELSANLVAIGKVDFNLTRATDLCRNSGVVNQYRFLINLVSLWIEILTR